MSFSALFNIGRTALQSSMMGMEVTGNNIANANTPYYSRQRIQQVTGLSVNIGGVQIGTGVEVADVQRIYDSFLGFQLYGAKSGQSDYQLRQQIYTRMESVIYPSDTSNLGLDMDEFFNKLHDVSLQPSGGSERLTVLGAGNQLIQTFHSMHQSLEAESRYANVQLEGYRDKVNDIAEEIANVNKEIVRIQSGGSSPNSLLDQRDRLINELSEYVDVTVIEQDFGSVAILVSGRQSLVDGGDSYSLELELDADDHNFYKVTLQGSNLTDIIQGGKINAVLETRSQTAKSMDELNMLAAGLVKEFNLQHRAGYGLDGQTGRDFFTALDLSVDPLQANTGSATVTTQQIPNHDLLSLDALDNYEIRFTDATTYDIVNTTDGTTVAAGQSYTAGSSISFFSGIGLDVAISGAPAGGDVFRVSTTKDMAREIQVAITNTDYLAAAQDSASLPGDNQNVIALLALRDIKILNNSSTTLSGYYQNMVSDIGSLTMNAGQMKESKTVLYNSMEAYRFSVSGVSLEEEEIRLVAYQHSYQAASRYLSVVDEVLETLTNL